MKKRKKKRQPLGMNEYDFTIKLLWFALWVYLALIYTLPYVEVVNRILQ